MGPSARYCGPIRICRSMSEVACSAAGRAVAADASRCTDWLSRWDCVNDALGMVNNSFCQRWRRPTAARLRICDCWYRPASRESVDHGVVRPDGGSQENEARGGTLSESVSPAIVEQDEGWAP